MDACTQNVCEMEVTVTEVRKKEWNSINGVAVLLQQFGSRPAQLCDASFYPEGMRCKTNGNLQVKEFSKAFNKNENILSVLKLHLHS